MVQANQAASSLIEALPAPASEALESAATALQSAATALQPTADELRQYISSDPKVGAAAAGVVFGIPLLANWKARFAGYSGQLQPDKAADMLNRRNFALIDIR